MRVVIVSTYPKETSQNIGDSLITQSLASILEGVIPEAHVDVVWRGDTWDAVRDQVVAADHVFFACLAIRPRIVEDVYPFLREIMNSRISYSVLSAGTDLFVAGREPLLEHFDNASLETLRELASGAKYFSTRGILTQTFCDDIGITNSVFDGDVAFYNPGGYGVPFPSFRKITRILISDPHRPRLYMRSFSHLVGWLQEMFPKALVSVVLHGVNRPVETYCEVNGLPLDRIYERPDDGLSTYDSCDLHVGYRVHGHVSALKRRRPSYLLEQDGRGADYGLTISRRLSVANYVGGAVKDSETTASVVPPQQLMSLIAHDVRQGFERFRGLEKEIDAFGRNAEMAVSRLIDGLASKDSSK